MSSKFNMQNLPGLYVPTTNIWDVDLEKGDTRELLLRLYQNINNIALALNIADKGYYVLTEFITGQQFFVNPKLTSSTNPQPNFRPVFRKVINFGPLPDDAGFLTQPHGLTIKNPNQYTFTRIYGTANDQTNRSYLPLPYASTSGNDIELEVTATDVKITTTSNRSSYSAIVVLEYLKL